MDGAVSEEAEIVPSLVSGAKMLATCVCDLIHMIHGIMLLNYTVVSELLSIIAALFNSLFAVINFVAATLMDFIHQYGEICASIIQTTFTALTLTVELVTFVGSWLCATLASAVALFQSLVLLPVKICCSAVSLLSELCGVVTEKLCCLASLEKGIIRTFFDGMIMISIGLYDLAVLLFSHIYLTFRDVVVELYRIFICPLISFIVNFARWTCATVTKLSDSRMPVEALSGLIICVAIVYAVKSGLIKRLWMFSLSRGFRLVSSLRHFGSNAKLFLALHLRRIARRLKAFCRVVLVAYGEIGQFLLHLYYWWCTFAYRFKRKLRGAFARKKSFTAPDLSGSQSKVVADLELRVLCIACQENERDTMLQPCRHICLCRDCAEMIFNNRRRFCPVCRAAIQSLMDVYL